MMRIPYHTLECGSTVLFIEIAGQLGEGGHFLNTGV